MKPFRVALGVTLGVCLALAIVLAVWDYAQHIAACWEFSWIGDCWAGWDEQQRTLYHCPATLDTETCLSTHQ